MLHLQDMGTQSRNEKTPMCLTVEVKRYPISMTGAKLRKRLGLSNRICDAQSWKVAHKFKAIKKRSRLRYLVKMCNRDTGVYLTVADQLSIRRGFEQHKLDRFPMAADCVCYCCDSLAVVRHHVTPISKGGRNKRNNIVPLCNGCHKIIHPNM